MKIKCTETRNLVGCYTQNTPFGTLLHVNRNERNEYLAKKATSKDEKTSVQILKFGK